MGTLKTNHRTLNLQQMNNCIGGIKYLIISYTDSNGNIRFKVIAIP